MRLILIFFLLVVFTVCNSQTLCVSGKSVNLRSSPVVADGNIISKLNYGTEVNILENEQTEWVKIEANGLSGYISVKYLVSCANTSIQSNETNSRKIVYVLICNSSSSYAYHSYECRGLSRCRSGISKITISEAESMGRVPCKNCY